MSSELDSIMAAYKASQREVAHLKRALEIAYARISRLEVDLAAAKRALDARPRPMPPDGDWMRAMHEEGSSKTTANGGTPIPW